MNHKFESPGEILLTKWIMSPEKASQILEKHNNSNRDMQESLVELRKKQILNGEWNARKARSIITFDEKGNLIDGQHRLRAIVETGVSVEIYVDSLPADAFTYFDSPQGTRRNHDLVVLHENKGINRNLVSLINSMMFVRNGGRRAFTQKEYRDEFEAKPEAYLYAAKNMQKKRGIRNSYYLALIEFFEINSSKAKLFHQTMTGQDALNPVQQAVVLKDRLLSKKWHETGNVRAKTEMQMSIYAMKKFMDDQKINKVITSNWR